MFIRLFLKRLRVTQLSLACFIVSFSLCVFCLHTFSVLYHNLTLTYVNHSKLTDLIISPTTSTLDILHKGLFLQSSPDKTIPHHEFLDHSFIDQYAPLYFGETYHGFTVIATTSDFFDILTRKKVFTGDTPTFHFTHSSDVFIGATAAKSLDLTTESSFFIHHHSHDHSSLDFSIAGVLPLTYSSFDSVIFISYDAFLALHPHSDRLIAPHFYWASITKPIFTYSLLSYLNSFDSIKAISPLLEKKNIHRYIHRIKSLLMLCFICLLTVTFFQFLMMLFFNASRYFHEFKVLFHSGASQWFLTQQLIAEFFSLLFFSSLLGVVSSIGLFLVFNQWFHQFIGFSISYFYLPLYVYGYCFFSMFFVIVLFSSFSCFYLVKHPSFVRL